MNSKNIYKSVYYSQNYPPLQESSLKESTAWYANHFLVIKRIFPQIYNYLDKKILEIGSSYGGFINNLNKEGFTNVTASDLDKSLFSKEIKNKFIYLDLIDTKKREEYDVVFAFEVLEHISESEKVVKNIRNLLVNEGLFIFTVPYPRNHNLYDSSHINMQYPNYWTNLFNKNGFILLKLEEITFIPFFWRYIKTFLFFKKIIKHPVFTNEIFFIFKKNF